MAIQVGDTIPASTVHVMGEKGPQAVETDSIFSGKKVVLFAVPGAFTPGCTLTHLPGYVVNADTIKAKGVDTIACMAVNDAFVMDAWGKSQNADELLMIGDGNGDFTKALDLEMDGSGFGLGTRSKRFAMIVDDGKVSYLAVEPDGAVNVSAAEKILAQL